MSVIMAALAALQQPDAKRLEEVVRAAGERRYVLRQRGARVGTRIIKEMELEKP